MEIAALILLILFSIIGFILIFITNFGTFIILLGCIIYAFMTGLSILSVPVLVMLAILYLAGEVLEYVFVVIGAKKFGASNKAVIGAIVGGILGGLFGTALFGIGIFLGTLFGIFLGTFIVELLVKKDIGKSLKAGAGSVLGRFGSVIAKVLIAFFMFTVVIYRLIVLGIHP